MSLFSLGNSAFEPSHTTKEVYAIAIVFAILKFGADQLLIISNLKRFYSSTILCDPRITDSNPHKSFFSRIEVDAKNLVFVLLDDYFYFSDLFLRVKCVTLIGDKCCSRSVWFTIAECNFQCLNGNIPIHFLD